MKKQNSVVVLLKPTGSFELDNKLPLTEWVSDCASWTTDISNNLCCYNAAGSTIATFASGHWMGVKHSSSSSS